MANPYQLFQTNPKAESEVGVYLDYGDFRIRIARAGGANRKFRDAMSFRTKPIKHQIDTDTVNEDVAKKLMAEVYADTVVLDMDVLDKVNSTPDNPVYVQGILSKDNEILPFDRKGVVKLFLDLPELFRDVQSQSQSVSLFREVELDAEIKNSLPASSGI